MLVPECAMTIQEIAISLIVFFAVALGIVRGRLYEEFKQHFWLFAVWAVLLGTTLWAALEVVRP